MSKQEVIKESGQLALALVVSAAISVVAIYFVVPQIARVNPPWVAQSLMACIVSAVWMWAGLGVAPRKVLAGITLFIANALGAAYYLRDSAYSVSAYYGIVPFAFACVGAGASWFALAGKNDGRDSRIASVLVPPVIAFVFASVLLLRPTLGFTRRLLHASGKTSREHMMASARTDFMWYMWQNPRAPQLFASDSGSALVETHPGSGLDKYSLIRLNDGNRESACALLRLSNRDVIESEISDGAIPRWIARLPYHEVNCDVGQIWRLVDIP